MEHSQNSTVVRAAQSPEVGLDRWAVPRARGATEAGASAPAQEGKISAQTPQNSLRSHSHFSKRSPRLRQKTNGSQLPVTSTPEGSSGSLKRRCTQRVAKLASCVGSGIAPLPNSTSLAGAWTTDFVPFPNPPLLLLLFVFFFGDRLHYKTLFYFAGYQSIEASMLTQI